MREYAMWSSLGQCGTVGGEVALGNAVVDEGFVFGEEPDPRTRA